MLIQTSAPRPLFDPSRYPKYLYIHTLAKAGVSHGAVFFNATTDPEHAKHEGKTLDPANEYPIEGEDGFQALEYVVPFWDLFQRKTNKPVLYDGKPASEQGVQVGSVKLARYCTNGFNITAKSAFRASPREYEEHTVALTVVMPVTGGGILRLADSFFDLSNSSFDPWAPNPTPRRNLEFDQVYNRTHKLTTSAINDRRAARVAAAEASMRADQRGLPEGKR